MRLYCKAILAITLAITPLAMFSAAQASAAAEDWRQSCAGPAYVCGGAKAATVEPVTKAKPQAVAKSKVKANTLATAKAGDETPVKAKNKVAAAKPKVKVAAKQDDDEALAPKKKKAKIAKIAKPDDGGGSAYQSGVASWYGGQFHGRKTANGETYNMWEYTAAHRTLPFGTRVKVTNTRNGDAVIVRINDRGPFVGGRVIDLSRAAASDIGIASSGVGRVKLTVLGKG